MSTPQECDRITRRLRRLETALEYLAEHGTGADLTPTRRLTNAARESEYLWWADYLAAADEEVRRIARRALEEDE